jgi:DNA replication initiation complex subunit (GINS family)
LGKIKYEKAHEHLREMKNDEYHDVAKAIESILYNRA